MKKITWYLFIFLFFNFIAFSFSLIAYSEAIVFSQSKVVYEMPYPGILPDHPLYPFKIIRDRVLEFMTRDNLKKAQLYLLYSDKRVAMAIKLIKKGKDKQAISTFSKGEKYFLKIPNLLDASKKQGVNPPSDFINKLKTSNAKHKEIIEEIMKTAPQGQLGAITEILRLNQEIEKKLNQW
ncbi:MAG: DUF5667 domain-containing protein [Microgenomates group bacterium]|nr:DUF5667 domain-containing protein [Microgenomates group bacterium]